jgi:hypothetical protein
MRIAGGIGMGDWGIGDKRRKPLYYFDRVSIW